MEEIAAALDRAMETIPSLTDVGPGSRLVGLAGTVSTLASLELGLVEYDRDQIHHEVLTAQAVGRWCDVLGAEALRERAKRFGLPAGRRDVIFAGALILREVMARLSQHDCIVSECDILDGLIQSMQDHWGRSRSVPDRLRACSGPGCPPGSARPNVRRESV